MKYAELVIAHNSNKTDRLYTYGCEFDGISVGRKVSVSFNRGNKMKDAYVFEILDEPKEEIKGLKYIASIDEHISLTEEAVKTCVWMKRRYACRYIDAVNCFTPVGNISPKRREHAAKAEREGEIQNIQTLTGEQSAALAAISSRVESGRHGIFLLHGVTGSGKTEVYMRSIAKCLESGRTAIMLVPEISLTKQITDRFIGRFGNDAVAVLHSRLSNGERYDEWLRIRGGRVKIVIGARSAVFAPLENIGAIILDEEHEATYKSDKTPKYDTVEIAIKRVKSQAEKGIVILGSATPSVVSFKRAEEGIYEKLSLTRRYNEVSLPTVEIADMRAELRDGNRSVFSKLLYNEMEKCLSAGSQVILFLNRRGYSTFINCRECGYVMKCPECGISLTYHKANASAVCHYCGRRESLPEKCPECGGKYIRYFGAGTEKVEEETGKLFPDYESARFDFDTIRKKGETDKILGNFKSGKTKILIGTQLVAKGLDFDNVGLVGIISADTSLNIPDFRSAERAFQLMTQAAGRAGRGDKAGKVVIQAYAPGHYSIEAASAHDYAGFYRTEIAVREMMNYPPFSDLIQVVFSAEDDEDARGGAELFAREFAAEISNRPGRVVRAGGTDIPVPVALPFFRQNGARYQLLVKSEKGKRNFYVDILVEVKKRVTEDKTCKFEVGIDINPYNFI